MLKLAEIYTDGAVMCHSVPVRIFGKCDAEAVELLLDGECADRTECQAGEFMLTLPPQKPSTGHAIEVRAQSESVKIEDVCFGEVWIAGGQSNMEYLLCNDSEFDRAKQYGTLENIRQFHVPEACYPQQREEYPQSYAVAPCWVRSTPDTCGEFSAVAWWFAREINEKFDMPVGIIYCNKGGTSASCWLSREDLLASPVTAAYLDDYDAAVSGKSREELRHIYDEYWAYDTQWHENAERLIREEGLDVYAAYSDPRIGECPHWPPPHTPWNFGSPTHLYQGMLSTIVPYNVTGALFYQGEEDVRVCERYDTLLRAMIARWRKDFRNENMPFFLVQIAPYVYDDGKGKAAYIRLVHSRLAAQMENVGVVVTTDCGMPNDIHPKNKRIIGERLAMLDSELIHSQPQPHSPRCTDVQYEDGAATLSFDAPLKDGAAEGFELCDEDGVWHSAQASVSGSTVHLTAGIARATGARYAFCDCPECNLYSTADMPAVPFSTEYPE